MSESRAREAIRTQALSLGFHAVGFARAELAPAAGERLAELLAQGWQGDMGWMAETLERRRDPRVLWPEARSVVVLAESYGPEADPWATLANPTAGNVSVYARHRDYHDSMKKRLKALARWMVAELEGEVKVFLDTAPVMEKPLAAASGIGWQGKHSNLLSRRLGNWFFLGEVFTTLELPPDPPETDRCGSCSACLSACPTAAFPAPYRLDARRCISYLTIEHKGTIGREFRWAMGNRIYGCDDCLAVCPWNKFARLASDPALKARPELIAPPLAELLELDDAAFRRFFSKSPIKRIGRDRFLRNVLIAAGNSGAPELLSPVRRRLSDASPLVRAMAVWALARLSSEEDFAAERSRRLPQESDPAVRQEWAEAPSTSQSGANQDSLACCGRRSRSLEP